MLSLTEFAIPRTEGIEEGSHPFGTPNGDGPQKNIHTVPRRVRVRGVNAHDSHTSLQVQYLEEQQTKLSTGDIRVLTLKHPLETVGYICGVLISLLLRVS